MRTFFISFLIFTFCFSAIAHANSVEGLWLTQNKRSVIKVDICENGKSLCGEIYWIIEGGMQYDTKNPDASRRNFPMCGLPILWNFKQSNQNSWTSGQIYKADDGDIYKANVTLLGPNTLKVRGYVGLPMFGKSQTWSRVSAENYPQCKRPNS